MEGTEALGVFAEVGAAFVGFVAILAVLSGRDGKLAAGDSLRAQGLMLASILVTFQALIPFGLYELGMQGAKVWRIASGCGIIAALGGLCFQAISQRRASAEGVSWTEAVGIKTVIAAWGFSLLAVISLVVNSLGLVGDPSSGLYIISLILGLGAAAALFLSVVFQRFL